MGQTERTPYFILVASILGSRQWVFSFLGMDQSNWLITKKKN
jgi:hypothetical protein